MQASYGGMFNLLIYSFCGVSENRCAMYFTLHRKTFLCTREAVKINMEDDRNKLRISSDRCQASEIRSQICIQYKAKQS